MHETELRQETPGKMQDFLSLFIRLLLYTVFLLVISHFCADFNTGSRNFHGFSDLCLHIFFPLLLRELIHQVMAASSGENAHSHNDKHCEAVETTRNNRSGS